MVITSTLSFESKIKLFTDPIRDKIGNHKNKKNKDLNEGTYSIRYLSNRNSIGYFDTNVKNNNGKDIFRQVRISFELKSTVFEVVLLI